MSDRLLASSPLAPEARPVLDGLVAESILRYGSQGRADPRAEVDRYPPEAFAPPLGAFLLLRHGEWTIGGGAFMSHDDETVELKRIWTHPDLRRQGLARRIVLALEAEAGALGYTRAFLTTGFRQPEAVSLYLSLGYRPLFDQAVDPALYRVLPFEKRIGARAGEPGRSSPRQPSATPDAAVIEASRIKAEQERVILARLARFPLPLAAE
ncbi:GNAT family N-acetyltransferase [Aureimonas ureilytica]|uniref:GNAT family N-acetyltransferase n=1 Tax=Aureimonas ureilytica TaxID=401562 RepID=UPI0003802C36|nr:GNAT family N-acetyltransferase [Aureimonas ureilytica]